MSALPSRTPAGRAWRPSDRRRCRCRAHGWPGATPEAVGAPSLAGTSRLVASSRRPQGAAMPGSRSAPTPASPPTAGPPPAATGRLGRWRRDGAGTLLAVSLAAGALAGGVSAPGLGWGTAGLLAWVVTAVAFLAGTWLSV